MPLTERPRGAGKGRREAKCRRQEGCAQEPETREGRPDQGGSPEGSQDRQKGQAQATREAARRKQRREDPGVDRTPQGSYAGRDPKGERLCVNQMPRPNENVRSRILIEKRVLTG